MNTTSDVTITRVNHLTDSQTHLSVYTQTVSMITNETGVPDKGTDQHRTPVGATPIVLNPEVQGEAVNLCCPECGEEIECWSADNEPVFEYRCGCDELRKFKIKGVTDE